MTSNIQNLVRSAATIVQSEQFEQFKVDAQDFLSARQRGDTADTQISQMVVTLESAAEVLNRSFPKEDPATQSYTNVISPVVIPKGSSTLVYLLIPFVLAIIGGFGLLLSRATNLIFELAGASAGPSIFFGFHYWLLLAILTAFIIIRSRVVMVPDGSQALITRFGKLEEVVGPGKKYLGIGPKSWRRKVSYIVNVTKEYPYNAPIREAPTSGRVNASVDLFLQFRIEDPQEFIFRMGGATGFSEKLHHAISEVTRALIYEQRAADIYDLVGESTQSVLDTLNRQFTPAVRFVNANITHAEPSSQEYRMDLAAAEVVKVAKEAYTYQYELNLRKSQDEGDLNRELAQLRQTLSEIRADIATYQAQIDTAHEKAVNKANAYARLLLIEAESEAKANAALLEAQALDIRTVNSAYYPEILEYRYKQEVLDRVEAVGSRLPKLVNVGAVAENQIDFMAVAREMLGVEEKPLYTAEDIRAIQSRADQIMKRIKERMSQLDDLVEDSEQLMSVNEIDPKLDDPELAQAVLVESTKKERR
ncbi:MAG: SPFH domain-containing protein [Anaerolineae bacterium]|nr:SPFH domain-containing protein [Anaerolineae bacterium]